MSNPISRELSLFPLGAVLFPGMVLPLRIFEERYKLMMKRCLEGDRSFGVALIKSGREVGAPAVPYDIGTLARIIDVTPQPGGRMNLIAMGDTPFRILEIEQTKPYIVGKVEMLDRPGNDSEETAELAVSLRKHFETYISLYSALTESEPKEVRLEDDPDKLSYLVASAMSTDSRRKQKLLEIPSAEERIREELTLLEQENLALRLFLSQKRQAQDKTDSDGGPSRGRFSPN